MRDPAPTSADSVGSASAEIGAFALTVRGPLAAAELGITYPHEHLLTGPPEAIATRDPDLVLDEPAMIGADLDAFRAAGGRTIVEVTTPDYGRDLAGLAALSRDSGVNIVAATGYNKALYSEALVSGRSVDQLAAQFIGEIQDSTGSGHPCGIIKIGTSLDEVRPTEQLVFAAGARAHLATGCPITTHAERGTLAERQLDMLGEAGVPASAVSIGHMDFCADMAVIRRVAERGAFVEFDQIPKPKYDVEAEVLRRVITLVDEGHADRVLLSGDFSRKSYFSRWTGGPGMAYLITTFRERLGDALVAHDLDADALLRTLFVENPRRALTFRGAGTATTASAVGWS